MLEELDVEYEVVPTGWAGGETHTPEFLAINPNGKIPTLVDGDVVVWESMAINLYLVRKCGGPLKPDSADAYGLAYRWSLWSMGEFEGPIDAVARHGVELPGDWAAAPLAVLEEVLGTADWLGGEHFGVSDLNVAVMFQRPLLAEVDRRPFPNVHAWLKRCRRREAFVRMMEMGRAAAGD
jgi:glutathione S-transferase